MSSMSNTHLPYKQDVANQLLRNGTLFVHLDPRLPGVMVPPWLRYQPQLVLQIGYDMSIPIDDLRVDSVGIYGTLSFSRTPFTCAVPWDAVFALVGDEGRGLVWPDSMPPEIASEVGSEAPRLKSDSIPPLPALAVRPKPSLTPTKLRNGKTIPSYLRVIK